MWTRPMIPYTGIRKGVSFTGITATIAICRCISLADRLLCARLREADEEPATGCVEELSRSRGRAPAAPAGPRAPTAREPAFRPLVEVLD
jgi:hypothetical protein